MFLVAYSVTLHLQNHFGRVWGGEHMYGEMCMYIYIYICIHGWVSVYGYQPDQLQRSKKVRLKNLQEMLKQLLLAVLHHQRPRLHAVVKAEPTGLVVRTGNLVPWIFVGDSNFSRLSSSHIRGRIQ